MTQNKKESESLEKAYRDLIVNRPSSLVRRALDDLARLKAHPPSGPEQPTDQLQKRQIRVVIGNFEENINVLLAELIKEVIKDKYALMIKWVDYGGMLHAIAGEEVNEWEVIEDEYALTIRPVFYGEALTEVAENGEADILIMIVNNIYFRSSYPPKERLEKSVQLITQIKRALDKPMIVFYPSLKKLEGNISIALEESVKQTGVDFYFQLSSNFDDFKAAFEKCMNKVLGRAS